ARILIVDDDERNLLALSEVLSPLAEIVTATSGRDALRTLLKQDFAVILLDVFMPGMDGYETASLIRQRAQTAKIPIIFLSAVNKETEHLMRGYGMGAVDYVFKPVDPLVLRSKAAVFVDLYLLRKRIEDQARAEQDLREAKLKAEAQRLMAETSLQRSRLRQAAIVDALPLVLFEGSLDPKGGMRRRFMQSERPASSGDAVAGFKRAEADWEDRIVEADRDSVESAYRDGPDRISVAYRWRGPDGQVLHLLEHAVRLNRREWVGSITDVTGQRQLEEQLVQAQKLDAMGQLTGGVAHDFNNILAAMLGGIELLERRMKPAETEQMILTQMREAAQQGVDFVRRLMAFARKQTLTPSVVDPHELRRSVAGIAEHTIGKAIAIDWRVSATERRLYADPSQLTLALVNLLINARDAMPGGGKVEVLIDEPDQLAHEPGKLRIVVRDEGAGIPADLIGKVTEPFFTTKPIGEGTGLGLSMVAGFVEQSGGIMRITSEPGAGTAVEIVLPSADNEAVGASNLEDLASASSDALKGRVLLVDDEEIVRSIVSEMLGDIGVEVETAADGREALARLRAKRPPIDFVLTDLAMPRMNGIQLLQAMSAEDIAVPTAVMTGNPDQSLLRDCPPSTPLVHKPLAMDALRDLVADAFARKAA
ncbi:MAG TPA: response regulator, partial [Reyranella sp.]|nr:response regulator [Reyranella sp.]